MLRIDKIEYKVTERPGGIRDGLLTHDVIFVIATGRKHREGLYGDVDITHLSRARIKTTIMMDHRKSSYG